MNIKILKSTFLFLFVSTAILAADPNPDHMNKDQLRQYVATRYRTEATSLFDDIYASAQGDNQALLSFLAQSGFLPLNSESASSIHSNSSASSAISPGFLPPSQPEQPSLDHLFAGLTLSSSTHSIDEHLKNLEAKSALCHNEEEKTEEELTKIQHQIGDINTCDTQVNLLNEEYLKKKAELQKKIKELSSCLPEAEKKNKGYDQQESSINLELNKIRSQLALQKYDLEFLEEQRDDYLKKWIDKNTTTLKDYFYKSYKQYEEELNVVIKKKDELHEQENNLMKKLVEISRERRKNSSIRGELNTLNDKLNFSNVHEKQFLGTILDISNDHQSLLNLIKKEKQTLAVERQERTDRLKILQTYLEDLQAQKREIAQQSGALKKEKDNQDRQEQLRLEAAQKAATEKALDERRMGLVDMIENKKSWQDTLSALGKFTDLRELNFTYSIHGTNQGDTIFHLLAKMNDRRGNSILGVILDRVSKAHLLNEIHFNIAKNNGETPFHVAASHLNVKIVQTFMYYGANPLVQTPGGVTPLDMALNSLEGAYEEKNNEKIVFAIEIISLIQEWCQKQDSFSSQSDKGSKPPAPPSNSAMVLNILTKVINNTKSSSEDYRKYLIQQQNEWQRQEQAAQQQYADRLENYNMRLEEKRVKKQGSYNKVKYNHH